jgi:hemerythrin-like domain-containing protein
VERAEALERDHRDAAPLHATLDRLGRIWHDQGQLAAEQLQEFRNAVTALAAMYKRHIAVEDSELFPAVEKLLNPEEKVLIGREMAARRGLQPNL